MMINKQSMIIVIDKMMNYLSDMKSFCSNYVYQNKSYVENRKLVCLWYNDKNHN